MRCRELGSLSCHRGCQRDEREVGKASGGVCILKRAGAVVACARHGRRDFRNQKRRDDDWVAAVLIRREEAQACGVPFLVRIERVDEDAGVNGVPRALEDLRSARPTPGAPSSGHPSVASPRERGRRSCVDETDVRGVDRR